MIEIFNRVLELCTFLIHCLHQSWTTVYCFSLLFRQDSLAFEVGSWVGWLAGWLWHLISLDNEVFSSCSWCERDKQGRKEVISDPENPQEEIGKSSNWVCLSGYNWRMFHARGLILWRLQFKSWIWFDDLIKLKQVPLSSVLPNLYYGSIIC